MKQETLTLTSKVLELNQSSNDVFMLINMCILTNDVNLNNAKFTDDFINGVVENKETYIGIPLCVNKFKLEGGMYNSLSHEFDQKSGQLKTQVIGAFSDYWTETDEDNTLKLMGSVKVYKRYPKVCEAMIELYEGNELEMSCEVLVNGYENIDGNVRSIGYEYDGNVNYLIGSAIVANPAEVRSKATLLIAEALNNDFEGDENLEGNKVEKFNKGNEIAYHGNLESASLKYEDVGNQIYNILNPINAKTSERQYNYWISDLYVDYVIVEERYDYANLWKIGYKIENDIVILDAEENWVKGYKGFIPEGVVVASILAENETFSAELNIKITELNNQYKEEKQLTEEQIKELQEKAEQLENKVATLEGTIVAQAETIKTHETKTTELSTEIESLKPFKEKYEVAEKEAKKAVLVEKFSKILSEEVMKSDIVVAAVNALDEVELNSVVVEQVTKELATKQPEVKEETVVVTASKNEDLIPTDKKSFWYSNKAE